MSDVPQERLRGLFEPCKRIVTSSKARSPVRSVLAPFVAMPFAAFVAPHFGGFRTCELQVGSLKASRDHAWLHLVETTSLERVSSLH